MAAILLACGCNSDAPRPLVQLVSSSSNTTIVPRTPTLPNYPCKQCHRADTLSANAAPRRLAKMHTRIALDHGDRPGWCYGCHDIDAIDGLLLPSGKKIAFDDSDALCGSCHGEKHADWRANIHGLTTGYWNGDKQRRTCTACHDPHAPRQTDDGWAFPRMAPLSPPSRPQGAGAKR